MAVFWYVITQNYFLKRPNFISFGMPRATQDFQPKPAQKTGNGARKSGC